MIDKFVKAWEANKAQVRNTFAAGHPGAYKDVVTAVVKALVDETDYETLDPERIVEIDHGQYQGTLLYVIGASDYQPDRYWFVKVGYGSCSGCDTLEALRGWEDGPPTEKQLDGYMTLALHIVQGLKELGGDPV